MNERRYTTASKGHSQYTAQLLDEMRQKSPFLQSLSTASYSELFDLVLYLHEPQSDGGKIIQLADMLSSTESERGDTPEKFGPLTSIFSQLFNEQSKKLGYDLVALSCSDIFPKGNPVVTHPQYKKLLDGFLDEFNMLNNETQLYYLLEKYLWCMPAHTIGYIPDISLFDHLKTTAAIALCLFDEYKEGRFATEDFKRGIQNNDTHFMLINGDVSGIQDFIFNIPSKGAAKFLKGHSVYITLLTDAIARYLLMEMGLKEANLLYNGGGNFYILAPKIYEEQIPTLKKKISALLLESHGGALYVALDYVLLSPNDFLGFNQQWEKVKQRVNIAKNRKWSEIGLHEHYHSLFGPIGAGSEEKSHCQLCGVEKEKRAIVYNPESEKSYCSLCAGFINLTNELKNADCLIIKETTADNSIVINNYQDIFQALGLVYRFAKRRNLNCEDKKHAFLLNDTRFLHEGFQGYRWGAYLLPHDERTGLQFSFEDISKKSTGDPKLALLKLDVDNLGNIFFKGLGEKSTISRITYLSRMLALYFEGYINRLIADNNWQEYLYVVFSGGDDTFIVGAWDKVLNFTEEFYNRFREFTCYHPQVTFSAGICIFRFNHPVIMSSRLTEEALATAKDYLVVGGKIPLKNKLSLFGEVFNWIEFRAIKNMKKQLLAIMVKNNSDNKDTFGRAFLFRIWKSTLGFKRILQDSVKGRVDNVRFWRLAYYLRDVARGDAEKLIEEYRKNVINNIVGKSTDDQIKNIMIIPAAVKWAQMETREVRGREDER
jgi:CRISPR-associated protein Csm1